MKNMLRDPATVLREMTVGSPTVPWLFEDGFYGGEIDWTDHFCGAGGSSLGLHHIPGFRIKYAINHSDLAIQAHAANFPDTDHEAADITTIHPRRFGRTAGAWFSPSCTAQGYCGPQGIDAESVRSRATMWEVVHWTAFHRYDVVVVENVVEVKLWCDVHSRQAGKTSRSCACGSTFDSWMQRMLDLGYSAQEVYFNSQHALVPQSRDRLYVVFTRDGVAKPDLNFRPPCWCTHCQQTVAGVQTWKRPSRGSARAAERLHQWGRYGTQYLYTCPNAECHQVVSPAVLGSWSIIDNTIPIDTIGSRKRPIAAATRRRIKVGVERIGRLEPIQVQVGGNLFERPGYARVWSMDDPLRTITTTPYMSMVVPRPRDQMMFRAGGQAPAGRTGEDPLMTVTAHDRQIGLLMPNKTNNVGRSTDEPAGAITTGGSHMLVSMRNHGDGTSTGVPAPTVTAGGNHHGLVVSMRNRSKGSAPQEPTPAQATRSDQALLVYNGNPGFVRALDDAAGTVTARDKQSLLVPYNRTAKAHGDHEPLTTVTTRDRSALLEITERDIDECLFRMLKWPELQRGQAMHQMPDGTPYQLTARVRTSKGTYKELTDEQRVKLIGNAVSSPVARMIGHAVARALSGVA